MKTYRKYILISLIAFFSVGSLAAQGKLDANLQFATMHYWRGLRVSNTPIFATSAGYFGKNFSAYIWSGVGLNGNYKEVDPIITFKHHNFNATLSDINNFSGLNKVNYFDYNKKTTNHIIDLSVGYNFSFVDVSWATILYGNDRVAGTSDQRFSTYVELAVPIKTKFATFKPFIASAFTLNSKAEKMLYSDNKGFSIVNLGFDISKKVKVCNYEFPVIATVAANPALNQASVQLAVNLF